jgi:hypothetical protein
MVGRQCLVLMPLLVLKLPQDNPVSLLIDVANSVSYERPPGDAVKF